MKTSRLLKVQLLLIPVLICSETVSAQKYDNNDRILPYWGNPYYWQYKGKPVMLLGGSKDDNLFQIPNLKEHLQQISEWGGNYVRNTMSDRPDKGHEIYPFKRLPNGKYDLSQWNEEYWQRFENFLRQTSQMDIIVQIEMWDRFDYSRGNWIPHPYNPGNNINYTYKESGLEQEYPKHPGVNVQPFFFTTPEQQNNKTILRYQQNFVNKLLDVSLPFPNVLYCIDNETSGEEAWAAYWAGFIRNRAEKEGLPVVITEMWDKWDLKDGQHRRTFDHPDRYDYIDVSQNNHQREETHWQNFLWVRNYISDIPRPMNSVKIYGSDNGRHGGNDNDAIEKFWRLIFAGSSAARFHRPPSGLGLSKKARTQLRSARLLLNNFNIFEAEPDVKHKLLTDREEDEAYLSHIDQRQYAIFFTDGGEVSLNLRGAEGIFSLKWLKITESRWMKESSSFDGGRNILLKTPGPGYWVALLTRQ